ncbi:U-box domain-containing protein 8-like [Mangifera indica]|uniref:U-box domain-containing protein 8-like n=1 Tax=Mangifera indica TaxID=29780 RepID=UPI001CF969B7|nr:U-box domain-containing protein 8-like [Mangifera indica]
MAAQFPDDFMCPISLEIMSDPVILSSGHTFDRISIQRWLESGHRTCPITQLPLPDQPSLIPNHALRSLISNFTRSPLLKAQSDPAHPNLQTLISILTSNSSPLHSKLESLSQLVNLSKRDSASRRKLTESGAVSAVLNCLNFESDNFTLQEKALSFLLALSLDDDNKVGIVAEGAVGRVVTALRVGSPDCRAMAATIITSLAVVEVNKATIGDYPLAIESLVWLLQNGKLIREKKEAATALYALSSFPGNRKRVVNCGAVVILMRIAESGLERAVDVLSMLAKCTEGREEMMRVKGCVAVLVGMIKNGSLTAVQCSLFTLNCLCRYSEEIRVEARRDGVLEMCMRLVEDDNDNEKLRRNANNLIQTLSGNPSMR